MLNNQQFHDLQYKQLKMDNLIFHIHDTNRQNTFVNRQLSFIVELSELMNEHRGFKYWSYREASPRKVLLEEYADALHFLLSLSLDVKINFKEIPQINCKPERKLQFINFTMNLFSEFLKFCHEPSQQQFVIVLNLFSDLGSKFKFSAADIVKAYNDKYQINFERQAHEY